MKYALCVIVLLTISTWLFGQSPSSHHQLLDENKGWLNNHDLGAKLPETYAQALAGLQDSIKADGKVGVGTKEHPTFYIVHTLNPHTGETTSGLAINVAPGTWELTLGKPIYGETVFPEKIIVSNSGVTIGKAVPTK